VGNRFNRQNSHPLGDSFPGPQVKPAPIPTAKASIEEMLALAIRLYNDGQRDHARQLCEYADAAQPPYPAVKQLLAVLALQRGDADKAMKFAAASLVLRPDHLPTLLVASDAAQAAGFFADARRWLEAVVKLAPENSQAWFQLALVRQDLLDLDGAALALRRVLQIDPGRADAEVNLGIVLQESGDMDAAMRSYGRAYRLREDTFGRIAHALATPRLGRMWLNLADLRAELARDRD
jgi:tetratricopeptide (TPR) repeat protein